VIYQQEHRELMRTVSRSSATEIAPHVEEWCPPPRAPQRTAELIEV
jgi:hypothetical protein